MVDRAHKSSDPIALRAKRAGANFIIDSIGVQGLDQDTDSVAYLFDIADEASVRDRQSIELLEDIGVDTGRVKMTGDLGLTIDASRIAPRENGRDAKRKIAINYADPRFYEDRGWREHVIKIFCDIAEAVAPEFELVYLPHVRHTTQISQNCIIVAEHLNLYSHGLIKTVDFPATVYDLIGMYRECDGVIAQRYHAMIIAKLLNLKSISLYVEKKSKYFAVADDFGLTSVSIDDHSYIVKDKIIGEVQAWN